MSSLLGPITFAPILIAKPWGGRRLESFGKTLPDDRLYGESWEIADLPAHLVAGSSATRTVVDAGPHAGLTLSGLIAEMGTELLGSASPTDSGDFPLLIKYLDAREHLSVQVHPDSHYVVGHRDSLSKTESWYVVHAEPDALLYLGFRDGIELADVEAGLGGPGMVELMQAIPANRGDFHHLPAGTVHALGAGVMVAEIQTPSDTTFRLYDWTEEYQREPRDLHLVRGLEALHVDAVPSSLPAIVEDGRRVLVETADYSVVEHRSSVGTVEFDDSRQARILMVVRGEVIGSFSGSDPIRLSTGRTVLIAASAAGALEIDVAAPATVLEIALI